MQRMRTAALHWPSLQVAIFFAKPNPLPNAVKIEHPVVHTRHFLSLKPASVIICQSGSAPGPDSAAQHSLSRIQVRGIHKGPAPKRQKCCSAGLFSEPVFNTQPA